MYLMVEAGIRGGLSNITKRHAIAHQTEETVNKSHNIYLDANNLYGWAMSQAMPYGGFEKLTEPELQKLNVLSIPDDSPYGYILEVDLTYPKHLHDSHSDFPVAPVRRCVSFDELSPYSKSLYHKLGLKGQPTKKLIADLHDKIHYIVHYRNPKLYLNLGLEVSKIHSALKFRQSFWLRDYISLNTERRKQAKNAFEKDFFKLMNNSIFGKTMENVRNRVDFELVHTEKRLKKLTARPRFHRIRHFNKDLVGVQCLRSVIKLNKPIYIGFCILDISKTLMYDFHYNVIRKRYQNRAELCFTDTDSLLYHIQTEDIFADMAEDIDKYDTSDFNKDHPLFSTKNKKVLGKMKDELAGQSLDEFVGLRAKMYSIRCGEIESKTAKGVKRSVIRQRLRHDMYVDCLYNERITKETMNVIRSFNHQLFSLKCSKIALSPFDDKRFVLPDKVNTRAHGHFRNSTEGVFDDLCRVFKTPDLS